MGMKSVCPIVQVHGGALILVVRSYTPKGNSGDRYIQLQSSLERSGSSSVSANMSN